MHKVPQESNIFYPHPSKRAAQFVFAAKPRISTCYKGSHSLVFYKKIVLKIWAKFNRKHVCQSQFFNKILIKRLQHSYSL